MDVNLHIMSGWLCEASTGGCVDDQPSSSTIMFAKLLLKYTQPIENTIKIYLRKILL